MWNGCPADTDWHVVQRLSAVLSTNIKAAKSLPITWTGTGYLVILVSVVFLSPWSRDLRGVGLSAANRSQHALVAGAAGGARAAGGCGTQKAVVLSKYSTDSDAAGLVFGANTPSAYLRLMP